MRSPPSLLPLLSALAVASALAAFASAAALRLSCCFGHCMSMQVIQGRRPPTTFISGEPLAALASPADGKILAALLTGPEYGILADAVPNDVRELLLRALQVAVYLAQDAARVVHHGVLADLALGDFVHAPLEIGGHLVGGYLRSEVRECLSDGYAGLRGHERVVVDVAPVVEVLND